MKQKNRSLNWIWVRRVRMPKMAIDLSFTAVFFIDCHRQLLNKWRVKTGFASKF